MAENKYSLTDFVNSIKPRKFAEDNKASIAEFRARNAQKIQEIRDANVDRNVAPTRAPITALPTSYVQDNTESLTVGAQADTYGRIALNTANAIGQGVNAAVGGITSTAANVFTGYQNMYEALNNMPLTTADTNIKKANKAIGTYDREEWLAENESYAVKAKREEFADILNDPNATEGEIATRVLKYYGSNPEMLLQDSAKVIPQSILEAATFGKALKGVRGLADSVPKLVAASAGASSYGSFLKEVADDPNNDLDPQSQLAAIAKGLTVGGLAGAGAGISKNSVDRLLVGDRGARVTNLKQFGGSILTEATTEGLDSVSTQIIDNLDTGKQWNKDIGGQGASGIALGGVSAGIMGANGAAANILGGTVEQLGKGIDAVNTKRNGTTEEKLNPESKKHNPVKVYEESLNALGSSDPKVRAEANANMEKANRVVQEKLALFEQVINEVTDPTEKAEFERALETYKTKVAEPLAALSKANTNYIQQNKDDINKSINTLISDIKNTKKDETVEAVTETKEVASNSTTPSSTKTVVLSSPSKGATGSFKATILKGESSNTSNNYNSVNLGAAYGYKSSTKNITSMTVQQILNAQREGKGKQFNAFGAYQMISSTFREAVKALPWLTPNTVMTAEVQDRIFTEYLANKKRPEIASYIKGNGNRNQAINAASAEWAALKNTSGRGTHDGDGVNKGSVSAGASLDAAKAAYKSYRAAGMSDQQAYHKALTGGTSSGGTATRTSSVNYLGDGLVDNSALNGLRIAKGSKATSNGKVYGYTAEFAHVTQAAFGDALRDFSSFNDNFHKGKKSHHNAGSAFDFSLKEGHNSKAQSVAAEARLHELAAQNGYKIRVLNEYVKPSKGSTGGHLHVTVVGRTEPTRGNTSVPIEGSDSAIDVSDVQLIEMWDEELKEVKGEETLTEEQQKKAEVVSKRSALIRNTFSNLTDEEVENSNLLSQKQKDALRKFNEVKEKLVVGKDTNLVTKDVIEGDQRFQGSDPLKRNLGLNQYKDIISQAVAANDVVTITKYMDFLGRFADSHKSKDEIFQQLIKETSRKDVKYVAPNDTGKWIDVSSYTESERKEAGAIEVRGENKLSKAINYEAGLIAETYSALKDTVATILPNYSAIVSESAPENATALVETTVTPVVSPAVPESTTTNYEPVQTTASPVIKTKFIPVNKAEETPSEGFYLGRSKDSEGNITSISALRESDEAIGAPGWLGYSNRGMPAYINEIKEYANKHDKFIPQLIADLSKPLYGYKKPKPVSETNLLADLAQEIKGKSVEEVRDIINRIDGYTKEGLVFGAKKAPVFTNKSNQGRNDRKVRSSIEKVGKQVGKASEPLRATNPVNEKSHKSAVGNNEYSNQYTASVDEEVWQVVINRNAKTNLIQDVSYIQGDDPVGSVTVPHDNMTDEGVMNWLKEVKGLEGNFTQANYSAESVTEPETKMSYVGRSFIPTETINKSLKVTDLLEKFIGLVDTKNISEKEFNYHKNIIGAIVNYNPEIKVRITSSGTNSYSPITNTIELNANAKEHLVKALTRLMIYQGTENLATKLEDANFINLNASDKQIIALNKELTYLKQIINRNGLLEVDEKLNPEMRLRLIDALSSNSKLLSAATTDIEIMEYLQGVSYNLENKKAKSNVFRKIVEGLRTFFNLGNTNQTNTIFDKLLEVTARTIQIQAMDKSVLFNKSEDAKVGVFRNVIDADAKAEMDKPFYLRNNLLAKFTQPAVANKPLSAIPNLASKLKLDLMQGLGRLAKVVPSVAQREQLEDFLKFRDEFSIHLMDTFTQKEIKYKAEGVKKAMTSKEFKEYEAKNGVVNPESVHVVDYSYQDLKSNLMNSDGTIDENTLTAAALAVYDWSIEYGNKTTNTIKDIRKLLNLDPNESVYIHQNIQDMYKDGVMIKNFQGMNLGKSVAKTLNIKDNDNGSYQVASELHASIGEWLISAMQSADLIHIRTMPSKTHLSNISTVGGDLSTFKDTSIGEESDAYKQITFISVVDQNMKNRNPRLQEIINVSKGTLGYMTSVFGNDVGLIAPLLTAPESVNTKTKKSDMEMSALQASKVDIMQQAEMRVNDTAYDAMAWAMDKYREDTLHMIGATITEEEVAAEHVSDRHSVVSAAEGILREVEHMMDFIGVLNKNSETGRQGFFDTIYGARNNRMHPTSNMVNFQLSKVHRAFVEYENFKTEVDTTPLKDPVVNWFNEDGTTSHLGLFMRAVMEQAEGTEGIIKKALEGSAYTQGFTVDKLPSQAVLDPFYEYIKSDEQVQAAIKSTSKLLRKSKDFSKEDMNNITSLVAFWEGGAGSFRALVELTQLLEADGKYTTSIGIGSDGINNGIAISTIQMGRADAKFLAQVGIIPSGEEYADINGYFDTRKIKDLGDYYEGLVHIMAPYLAQLQGKGLALKELNTTITGRKFMKSILIPFGYSAGNKRLQSVAFEQLLTDIKGSLVKLSKEENPKLRATLETSLSTVLETEVKLPQGKELLEVWFSPKQIGLLKDAHNASIAKIIPEAIKEYAGDFIESRDFNLGMHSGNSDAYLEVKKSIEAKGMELYKESLKKSEAYSSMTEVELDKLIKQEGIPKAFYDEHVESVLKTIRPKVKTPFTHMVEETNADFNVTKRESHLVANSASQSANKRVSDGALHSSTQALVKVESYEVEMGISLSSAQVQGMDAYIAAFASAMNGKVNRNIHDQGDSGLSSYADMGQMQNKATFEGLKNYHVQAETLSSLGRTISSITDLYSNGAINADVFVEAIKNALYPLVNGKQYEEEMQKLGKEPSQIDVLQKVLVPLSKVGVLRVRNNEALKLDTLKNIRVVQQYAGENGEYIITEKDLESIEEQYAVVTSKVDAFEANLNKMVESLPTVTTDSEVVAREWKDNINNVTSNIKGFILEQIKAAEDVGNSYSKSALDLANYVMNTMLSVNPNLRFETAADFTGEAYYSPKENKIVIHESIINGDNPKKIVTVMLHEIVHAVTFNKIKTTQNDEVLAAYTELSLMHQELKDKAKDTNSDIHDRVLENVFEMIAYGLTEHKYMKWIAQNLQGDYVVPTTKAGNAIGLKNGLKKFMDAVKAFLFKDLGNSAEAKKGIENFEKMQRLADITMRKLTQEEIKSSSHINVEPRLYSRQSVVEQLKSLPDGNTSEEHSSHLDELIESTIASNYELDSSVVDKIINKVSDRAIKAGFALSSKEVTTMEIVKVYVNEYLKVTSGTKTANEIRDIFKSVTSNLTIDDFLVDPENATKDERTLASSKLKYIKGNNKLNAKEHLERFVALAATSEEFRTIIDKHSSQRKSTREGNWFDSLMAIVENIVIHFTSKALHIKGLSNSAQVDSLLNRLDRINSAARRGDQNRVDIAYEKSMSLLTKPLNKASNAALDGLFVGVEKLAANIPSSNVLAVALGTASKLRATGLDAVLEEAANQNAMNNPNNRMNGLGELWNEMVSTKGMKATIEEQIRMTNKQGQNRDTVKKATTNTLLSYFSDAGKNLTKDMSDTITQVVLRTDVAGMFSAGYNLNQVIKLLGNKDARDLEITKLEGMISEHPESNDILIQAKSLAKYLLKEEASPHLMKNVESIAVGKDSWYETDLESMDTKLRDQLDALVSLYALDYASKKQLATLGELIKTEPEGMKAVLQTQKDLIALSKEEFKNNPYNYVKGYVPQLTNHLKSLIFAESKEEVKALENEGWMLLDGYELTQDKSDKSTPRILMYHNDMFYQDYVSGALDMKDKHSKGTVIYDKTNSKDLERTNKDKFHDRRKRNATVKYNEYNPFKDRTSSMIAKHDTEGNIIEYRYEMSGALRDAYLERINNGFELMGILASDLVFKPAIAETQRNVATSLYQDYKDNFGKDPRQFVVLDPNSSDEHIATMYKMMPRAFKDEATKLFGKGSPIVVRSNVYNAVFGFRSYSLSEMFNALNDDKMSLSKAIAMMLNSMFDGKGKMRILQAERLYQRGIDKIKNYVVIRNVKVLIGNLVANSLLLSLQGVPPVQQAKDFVEVWRNGKQYRKADARLASIDVEISINQSRPKVLKELKREQSILRRELETNPLHEFMKAGLMSTIVEDIGSLEDETNFKSEFDKKVEKVVEILPQEVRTALDWVTMSEGTPLHEFMKHSTQFSDLAAKYSLARHKMKNENMSMKRAITEAQDNFINYDVPTGRGMDYMNKMGLFMFTKFFLRFQQVLVKMLNQRAGSTIAQHLAIEQFTGLSGVLDPLAVTRIGNNPLEPGIFGYDEAFANISSVKAIHGILF